MKQRTINFAFRTVFLFLLTLTAYTQTLAQTRKLNPHQVIDIGGGVKVEILSCTGTGADEVCDVIYYTEKRQTGKRMWQSANKIRDEEQIAYSRKMDSLRALYKLTIPEKKITQPTTTEIAKAVIQEQKNAITANEPKPVNIDSVKSATVGDVPNNLVNNNKATDVVEQPVLIADTTGTSTIIKETQLITVPPNTKTEAAPKKLGVFIDCNSGCDMNFLRTEITLVDFLLDRLAADVHVLVNEQRTGSEGSEIQLIFYGQHHYKSTDTLLVNIPPNSTSFERRSEMLKGIKAGLMPFLLKTAYAKYIDLKLKVPEKESLKGKAVTKDSWNYWVFRLGADGSLDQDQVYKSTNLSGNVSMNRTTEKLKVNFRARSNYYNYKYNYEDNGTTIVYEILNKEFLAEHSLIKSLGSHWGIGYQAGYSTNTFANNKGMLLGKAAIEYSIFPYKDVNTRFFTVTYGVDVRNNKYFDTTLYFKTEETLVGHSISANISLFQKWGSFNSSISYRNFFNDPSLSNLSANLYFDIRITGGLSFYINSYGAYVRDQVYLLKGKASEQDVLTKRRALASTYTFSTSLGVNFRFGSRLNNFVNPRLGGL